MADTAFGQAAAGSVKLTLEQAIELAIQRNHGLLATRTTIQQNLAQEVTANLRPNPTFFTDWEYLPLYKPNEGILDYLHDSTEGDIGMSYMFERGEKRQHRLEAAQDATAVTRCAGLRQRTHVWLFRLASSSSMSSWRSRRWISRSRI